MQWSTRSTIMVMHAVNGIINHIGLRWTIVQSQNAGFPILKVHTDVRSHTLSGLWNQFFIMDMVH